MQLDASPARELARQVRQHPARVASGPAPADDGAGGPEHPSRWRRVVRHLRHDGGLPPAARAVPTGGGRGAPVATAVPLWSRAALSALGGSVRGAQAARVAFGESTIDVVLPGYTHLPRAPPVLLAPCCLASLELPVRDRA